MLDVRINADEATIAPSIHSSKDTGAIPLLLTESDGGGEGKRPSGEMDVCLVCVCVCISVCPRLLLLYQVTVHCGCPTRQGPFFRPLLTFGRRRRGRDPKLDLLLLCCDGKKKSGRQAQAPFLSERQPPPHSPLIVPCVSKSYTPRTRRTPKKETTTGRRPCIRSLAASSLAFPLTAVARSVSLQIARAQCLLQSHAPFCAYATYVCLRRSFACVNSFFFFFCVYSIRARARVVQALTAPTTISPLRCTN